MHSDLTIVPGTAVASLYQFFSSLAVVFTDHELADLRDLARATLPAGVAFRAASAAAISDVASASSRPKEKHQQQQRGRRCLRDTAYMMRLAVVLLVAVARALSVLPASPRALAAGGARCHRLSSSSSIVARADDSHMAPEYREAGKDRCSKIPWRV